jgi:hypothetical protein
MHLISKETICNNRVQFVDDSSQFLNLLGAASSPDFNDGEDTNTNLQTIASKNSTIWAGRMWISGGNLNLNKCFF